MVVMSGFSFLDSIESIEAETYLEHCYAVPADPEFPLPDEDFVQHWRRWLQTPEDRDRPDRAGEIMGGGSVRAWIEETPAGGIPVLHCLDRGDFERLAELLKPSPPSKETGIPASVNAFTIRATHPAVAGHRVILLHRAGYSALSGRDFDMTEDEWLEKSMTLRLHHECCHYFTSRVLGGMKNHALDEVVADCIAQLETFDVFSANMQRKFFGLSGRSITPEGRLNFYVRKLSRGAADEVCTKIDAALSRLESWLFHHREASEKRNRPTLIIQLASVGLNGMTKL